MDAKGPDIRELPPITNATDTRDYLGAAAKQALMHDDYEIIVDMDAHLQEKGFWPEVMSYLENDVLRYTADNMMNVAATRVIPTISGRSASLTEFTARLPMPGRLKMLSVMMAPPRMGAMVLPMSVAEE